MRTLLDAIDAATGRDDPGDLEVAFTQTFATVWALAGYVVWIVIVTMVRVAAFLARAAARPWRS
jgi:hypothetical protein